MHDPWRRRRRHGDVRSNPPAKGMPLKRRFATQPAVWRTGARVVFYEVVNKLFVAAAVAVAVVVFSLQSCCNVHSERPAPVAAVKINFGKVSFHKKLPFTLRSAKRSFPRVDEYYFNPTLLWPTRTVNNIIGTIAHSNSRAIEREREKHLRTDQRFCSPSSFSSSLYKTKSKKNFESVILWGSDLPTLDIGSWGTRIRASFY